MPRLITKSSPFFFDRQCCSGIMSTLCVIFYFTPGPRAGGRFEDINDAVLQIYNSTAISLAIGGTILSIAFFNFSGISVTKEMSATTRMVLDSVRTIVIWAYGLLGTCTRRKKERENGEREVKYCEGVRSPAVLNLIPPFSLPQLAGRRLLTCRSLALCSSSLELSSTTTL